jgi:glutamine synthetase
VTADEVLVRAREANVRFVRLQFTDVLGVVKNVAIPVESLPAALAGDIMFDGSSLEGFVRIEEADMYLQPDPATFQVFPWTTGEAVTARLMCDVVNPDGTPFAGCPRSALKRVLDEMRDLGFTVEVAPEIEFFLFERDQDGMPTTRTKDLAGYFDLSPVDEGEDVRREIVLALESMGFQVEASHHEVAPGQHEIDLAPADALTAADHITTLRVVARTVARRLGYHATFMPKPVAGINGSGLHLHHIVRTLHGGENALADPTAEDGLSAFGRQYLAGLIRHAKGFTAVTNPLINSYKRLVPGFEAPIFIAWSSASRSPMVRVVAGRAGRTHLELRSPDPSCNPYLALAATIRAGLDGIRHRLTPPPPVRRNLSRLSEAERRDLGVENLPASLIEALQEFRRDTVVQEALGEYLSHHFLEAKHIEWDVYRTAVHPWEVDQYLTVY